MKTNQLFSKARWLLASCLLLLIFSTDAWGAMELANINFKSWTSQSISAGSTVNGCYFKSAVTISAANGATFGGKATTSSNWVAIPLSGINGSITITLTHASSKPQWKNYFKGLNAAPSSSDLSSNPSSVGDNTRPGSNTTTSSWTISTDKLYGVFYVGKGNNGLDDIYSITITTPDWTYYYRGADNSWGGTAMTNSSAGFYSYKSSTTNNHQFKIAKSADGWDYNYSFVDAGYLGTSISSIGDYGSDNCYIWSAPASYYIIVFRPGSPMNTTASPKICASATLPAEKFTISFNNGGGSGSMSSLSNVLYGSDKAITANTFTKDGYRFTGWHANVDVKVGGATKTAGTLLDDEVTIQEIKSDITLTAQWEVDDGCNKIFWFANSADATTNGVTNNTTTFSGVSTGTTAVTGSITIDGKTYTATGRGSNNSTTITFTVPASKVGTLYGLANSSGNSARTLTLTNTASYSETQSTSASSSTAGAFTFADMPAGSYSLAWSGNGAENMLCLKLCDAGVVCTATAPGALSKGTLSGCSRTITASGSAATNNTWYWQSSASGTDKSDAYSSGKAITETGTYYLRSFCSDGAGCWSDAVQVTITAADMTPAAPTALAAASPTAKGVTLTVTDAANTNDYEFYVSTSSSAPSAGTSASYTSTSKSVTITDKYAGTTFYAWARAKCGSNKSAWTALGDGGTFTTSTVTVTHTLTNVTKTSGEESAGGSDYTAVFAAVSGYSMPTPTVTIDGNTAASGTDYTWSSGTLTIPANKINGNIVITLNSAAAAPSSVAITGNWLYFAGETIELTATPTGGNGPVTYQWYKGGKENGNAIEGATTATYTKATCAFEDAGSYYCKVTCGGSQSTWGQSGAAYNVKIPRLYVKTGRNDGVKSDFGNVDFTRATASTATASITLGSNWDYCFNIADGCGHYYGNAGTMQYNNYGPWTTNVNNQDCGLRTTNGATYVFTIDYSNWEQLKTTVTFPSSDQAADKIIYFDNQTVDWSTLHYRIGRADHTQATPMTKVPGTNNLYTVTTAAYNNAAGWHIANNAGWTGSNSIYRTYTDGDQYSITYATAHEGGAVTDAAVTVTPTTSRGTGADAGINDNCTFYNYEITTGMKTQNVAISDYSNGTITVNYVNTSNEAATLTSGNADLAHSVILTSITAVPNTGYDASAITINGGAYSANYVVTGATTIAASFTPHVYSIALNKGDHGAANQSASVAYLADALTSITHVAANTGYNRLGYYDGATKVLNADGSFAASTVSGYITDGVWTKTSDAALTAKWEAQTYTISYKDKGNKTYSGSNLASLPTSHTYGSSTALVDGVKSGYTFVGWYTDEDCTVSAGSSIGATAKTANFTLYAKWTYSCPADNSGETIYKFVPVTSSSDNIADATDFTTENYLSELTGGTLVSHCSASGNVKMNSNGVQLASSTGYLELNFECALQTGDKVKWKCYSAAVRLCNSTTYDSSKDLVLAKSQDSYSELYITSSMEGKKKLYLMHSGSNSTVMTFELYRAGGYNVTYKANGSGESDVAHVTATVEDNMFTRNGYTFTGWNTDDEGEGDAYSAGDDVTEDLTLYAQWTCITPTFGTNLSTTPHEVEQGDAAVTLTVAATANSGTVTYQWYSNTSKSTAGATTLTTGASYNAPTSSVGTLYYYCVATNSTAGCSTTTQSNYATVTVSEAPCLRATITKNSSSYSLSSGETKDITSDATITSGGAVKLVNYNSGSKSFSFSDNGVAPGTNDGYVEVVLPSGSVLDAGSVIRITGAGTESGAGLLLIDDAGTTIASQTNNGAIDFSYTVTAASTLKYKNHVRIARAKASSKNHFKSVTIIGCVECTPITPSLTYSKTTIWMDDADKTATPTLTGYYGTPTITYTSSDPTVVRVDNASTGAITALKRGTATITATIGATTYSETDYCGNTATCNITVKDAECGMTLYAVDSLYYESSTRKASVVNATNLMSGLSGSSVPFKLNSKPSWFGLRMATNFQVGDSVVFKIQTGDLDYSGTSVSKVPVKIFLDRGTTGLYEVTGATKTKDTLISMTVTQAMITAGLTDSLLIYRSTDAASPRYTQNHKVYWIKVYRYVCPDIFIYDDAAGTHEWSDDDNWIGAAGHGSGLPTSEDRVFINESVTVDVATASAAEMNITNGSMVTVEKSITVGDVNIETGSTLNVAKDGESGITVATNSLYLKGGWNSSYTTYDMPRIYIDPASTLTKVVNTVNLDISVDSRNYYPIAVPFKVKVSDVDYANSTLAGASTYGTHYVIKDYDGARRAGNGPDRVNNWKVVPETESGDDVYLEPGRGYIMTAVSIPSYGGGVIRFPMSFTNDWTAEGEQGTVDAVTKNVVAVKAYEGAATAGDKKVNKGWNLLGVPFMSCYGTGADMGTDGVVMQGKFDFKTGDWKEEAVRYVNVPVHDFSEYIQVDMEDDDPVTVLRPGWCFFVQVEEDGDLTFLTADQAASSSLPIYAPKRGVKADMPTVKTGIILSDGEKSDKTTFLVSDKYNGAEYEINADMEKMFGNGYTLATYSLSGTTRLAYNALGNADAANIIPIGYRAPADGEYTFSINPRYAENGAFENVNLIDYETGIVTDLLKFSYTFSTERTQNDTRFALNVVKQKETPTDIELVGGDAQVDGPRKLLLDGKMYIILDGKMFDAQGKRVQ